MLYQEFIKKVINYGMQKDPTYNQCSISYNDYKNIVEPRYMASSFTTADDFCRATFLDYVD